MAKILTELIFEYLFNIADFYLGIFATKRQSFVYSNIHKGLLFKPKKRTYL